MADVGPVAAPAPNAEEPRPAGGNMFGTILQMIAMYYLFNYFMKPTMQPATQNVYVATKLILLFNY